MDLPHSGINLHDGKLPSIENVVIISITVILASGLTILSLIRVYFIFCYFPTRL